MSTEPAPSASPAQNASGAAEASERRTVHVRFAPAQGARLRRPTPPPFAPLWTERPLVMQRTDGSYDLIGSTTHLDGLVRWILSHGAAATVAAPARLRRRVAAEARRIRRRYQPDDA